MDVTFLGLGAMGSRMAARLGDRVVAYNRTPSRGQPATARDAATNADVVLSMVRDDEAAEAVWLDPAHGALAAVRPGTLIIESSTVTPGFIARLRAAAEARGARCLDAPVVGSLPQAEAGQLVFLVGGDGEHLAAARPVLERMGTVVHVGPSGHGAVAKLVVNALFATQIAALAEGVGLAERHGLDGAALVEAIGGLPVFGPALRGAAALMVAGDDAPRFPIRLVAKDLRYAVAAGAGPVVDATRRRFEEAEARGGGDRNATAVGRYA